MDPFDAEPLCCLVGPTASGKTELALDLAERTGAEIVSLDSMLVYRGMDIGTAKPTAAERERARHHAIDCADPDEVVDVSRWLEEAREGLRSARERGQRVLFVGGTGFYLAALLRGLFAAPRVAPELRAELEARARAEGSPSLHAELAVVDAAAAERIHANDEKRVVRALEVFRQTGKPLSAWQAEWGGPMGTREASARLVGVRPEDEELDRRIAARTGAMLDAGWREEALAIRNGPGFSRSSGQALGYREVLAWADGAATREETETLIAQRTRRFSRRQGTWYRKFAIQWLAPAGGAGSRRAEALATLDW